MDQQPAKTTQIDNIDTDHQPDTDRQPTTLSHIMLFEQKSGISNRNTEQVQYLTSKHSLRIISD